MFYKINDNNIININQVVSVQYTEDIELIGSNYRPVHRINISFKNGCNLNFICSQENYDNFVKYLVYGHEIDDNKEYIKSVYDSKK